PSKQFTATSFVLPAISFDRVHGAPATGRLARCTGAAGRRPARDGSRDVRPLPTNAPQMTSISIATSRRKPAVLMPGN
ncbi:hypothetical protein AAHH79_41815, partial [Burkholderia pseudomallei]